MSVVCKREESFIFFQLSLPFFTPFDDVGKLDCLPSVVRRYNNHLEETLEPRCNKNYHQQQRTIKYWEENQTHEFNEGRPISPTSSGQGREKSIDLRINYNFASIISITLWRELCLSHIPKETLGISFQFGLISNSANFLKQPEPVCRSTDPSTGRPCRSTVPNRELSTLGRSTGRSTALFLRSTGRGRPLQSVHIGAQQSTGPVVRSTAAVCARWCTTVDQAGRPCCCCWFPAAADSLALLVLVDFLDFLPLFLQFSTSVKIS